jgi:hypothetical protein
MTATYIALATITLTSNDSEVLFSSIPSTYRDLVLVVTGATNEAATDSSVAMRINGDTGSNYSWIYAWGTGSAAASGASADSRIFVGRLPGFSSASSPGTIIIQTMDYSQTNKHKAVLTRSNNNVGVVAMHAGRWGNTAAVTSLGISRYDFASGLVTGSTLSLYGIN